MSRSHSYSSNQSRESRPYRTPNLAVTEASFQGLQLSDGSLPSSYSTSNQYRSRGSYGHESLNPNYLTSGYDTASFGPNSPAGSYLGSQRAVSPFTALETEPGAYYDTEASAYGKADMSSYGYHRTAVPSSYESHSSYASSKSPSIHDYAYAGGDPASRRSMSYPSGPHVLPSTVWDAFSTEDREVARQRRRGLQESRRLAKARVRRSRLPTIVEPDTSMGMHVSHSIDFLAAPSTSSSYEIGGSGGYPRTTSTSSASYVSGATGYSKLDYYPTLPLLIGCRRPSSSYHPSYTTSYGVGDVGTHPLYPA
ncbi:MAG: hypothetical protein LQ348_004549 [Seirophora lacunosa]|nr:MAG: hypothetical protein LQ348_004549 [Seirophora lacunosa]